MKIKWFEFICNTRKDERGNPHCDIVIERGYSQEEAERKIKEAFPNYLIERTTELKKERKQ